MRTDEPERIPVLALVGPTGVGKTALAIALGHELPIEAVSVDSRQVYRRLDIGTGKPTAEERRALRHHLVDVAEPDERYDAARFRREAAAAIADIHARDRIPVLVGGTGLYYRALVRGLRPAPPADPAFRRALLASAGREGEASLHRRLAAVDPTTAARLHPRDLVRVTRALEVAARGRGPAGDTAPEGWRGEPGPYRVWAIGLTMERQDLFARLDARVDRMLAGGLLAEVEALLASGLAEDLPSMQGIGYRHLAAVVAGRVALGSAVSTMKRDTRRYAKRQWTWFRREPGVRWVSLAPGAVAGAVAEVKKSIDETRLFRYAGLA